MYVGVNSVVPVVATAGAATLLPNTGSNTIVTVAISVAVGLLAWGVVYGRQAK
jgi:LPXTG-motif cell wall-anchored protein